MSARPPQSPRFSSQALLGGPDAVFARALRATRTGTTFLEVILAATLLVLVTSMIMSAIGNMMMAQVRQQRHLAAAELANRLVLQYLDDKHSLPATGSLIRYAPDMYHWDFAEKPITLTFAKADTTTPARANQALSLNRLKAVTLRVWLAEESGGERTFEGGAPAFAISRIVDPIALRNPDSIDNMLKDPVAYKEFIANFTGVNTSGVPQAPGGGSRPISPSSTPAAGRTNTGGSKPAGSGGKKP